MGKIKKAICKFINTKIFSDSYRELKDDCYKEEKLRVSNEFNKLENSYSNLKSEYTKLANHKFVETINNDLKSAERQKENVVENQTTKAKENENPFDDWR